ncbi:MAG: hypothetical protein ACRDD7_14730 [Peptostreptococcaceae bacterium]
MRKIICFLCIMITIGLIGCENTKIVKSKNIEIVEIKPIVTVLRGDDIGREEVLVKLQNISENDVESVSVTITSNGKIVDKILIEDKIKSEEIYSIQHLLKKDIDYKNCTFEIIEN